MGLLPVRLAEANHGQLDEQLLGSYCWLCLLCAQMPLTFGQQRVCSGFLCVERGWTINYRRNAIGLLCPSKNEGSIELAIGLLDLTKLQ